MSLKTVFSVLLLCMLVAATPMEAGEHGAGIDNSGPWMWCDPAFSGHPVPELKGCRTVVKLQCAGRQVPEAVQRNCCQQLADVTNDWCRCGALSSMLNRVYEELGVRRGDVETELFPGCRKEVLHLAAASVPAVCKVYIPNGYGIEGRDDVCYWAKSQDF